MLTSLGSTAMQPVQPHPAASIDHHLDDVRILECVPDKAAETIAKRVGHGNQLDVGHRLVVQRLDGGPVAASAAADQGQLDDIAAGGVRASSNAQSPG